MTVLTEIGNTRIITCAVFKPALEHLKLVERLPDLRITYLPSNLHMKPQELRVRLLRRIVSARKRNELIICLYGDCFPGMDDFCQQQGIIKAPGFHCFEMLLGGERFKQLIEETAGTYFLERNLILNFEAYCGVPLELHDEEMRKCLFNHYQRLLYVKQPSDPDLTPQVCQLAEFLELSLEIQDADYSYLEKQIVDLVRPGYPARP